MLKSVENSRSAPEGGDSPCSSGGVWKEPASTPAAASDEAGTSAGSWAASPAGWLLERLVNIQAIAITAAVAIAPRISGVFFIFLIVLSSMLIITRASFACPVQETSQHSLCWAGVFCSSGSYLLDRASSL